MKKDLEFEGKSKKREKNKKQKNKKIEETLTLFEKKKKSNRCLLFGEKTVTVFESTATQRCAVRCIRYNRNLESDWNEIEFRVLIFAPRLVMRQQFQVCVPKKKNQRNI